MIMYILAVCNLGQKFIGVSIGAIKLDKLINVNKKNNTKCLISSKKEYVTLYKSTFKSLSLNPMTYIFGGDHSISAGSVSAFFDLYKDKAHLIWVDAHADINTYKSSSTKNTHGMPLSKIFGLMKHDVKSNFIPSFDQLTYYGLRSVDEPEQNVINEHKINNYTSEDIKKNLDNIIIEIVKKIGDKVVFVSFDIDALDSTLVPCTGTSVPNGLEEIHVIKLLNSLENLKCLEIVEYNPLLGTKSDYNKTKKTLINIFSATNII